ncbi:hypothetical protein HON36_04255 [Candidatus Parcubacteria bacterium]|jgi:hypothetical protein|nr:hypothetical protein [Candidatus Parcubacteria bacterium]MBT7228781.1 hypothetical protein [Candidatus Parcubacteria bacterium]
MPIENCKDLRGDLEFLKKLMEECGEIFYSSITNKDTRRLKELRSSFIAIMDGIKKFFFDPEKIKDQLIRAVFLSRETKNKDAGIPQSDADEWFEENIILKPETREVIYKNEHFEIEGFEDFDLPDNMTILGDAYIHFTEMKKLPKRLRIVGDLKLSMTEIEDLPDDIQIEGNLTIVKNKHLLKKAKKLAKKHQIWGKVEFTNTSS